MNESTAGRFVWYELMTTDTKAAIAFYTEVIGWKTQPFAEGSPADKEPYTMWVGNEGPLGGVMTLPAAAASMGVPPSWMAHVEVVNVDDTVALATKLGGKVHVPPTDIPTVGRFSVIADPTGAPISVFTPAQAMKSHDSTKAGEFTWSELLSSDAEAAFTFYSELFGWKQQSEMDMGAMGKYRMFGQGDKTYGGMFTKGADMPMPSTWIYYIHVDDLDATLA
ncbi:MAG: VOC family protein, partial [Minicystis sp.]